MYSEFEFDLILTMQAHVAGWIVSWEDYMLAIAEVCHKHDVQFSWDYLI